MPASITLFNLSWSAADRTPLFSDLTLGFGPERTGIVGRNGCGKTTLLRLIAGELSPTSGNVSATGSAALMRQAAARNPEETVVDLFGAASAMDLLDRAGQGLATVEDLAEADWTLPDRIAAALARCGLSADPRTPLTALSGGQQTRAALAALVFSEPDFLLLDEPTNNLDSDGRAAVFDLLQSWRGGAIVVSHDRSLLEQMDAIVELTSLGAARFGGNYSAYRDRKNLELDAARRSLAEAEKTRDETARRARIAAERKARTDRMGRKSRARCDQSKMLLDAAKERSEASGGANARLRSALAESAEEALNDAREKIEVIAPLHMEIASTGLPQGRTVLRLDGLTGGYDAAHPLIRDLSLTMTGPERLALSGQNGSGKSTLLALIAGRVIPQRGTVERPVPLALLDQNMALLDPSLTLRDTFHQLNPGATDNICHATLARFRFRAGDALKLVGTLSGGERLRAGLACVLGRTPPPGLLILDEPTNHLDLDGITALETALNAYDGALIVVSHDTAFLDAIRVTRHLSLSERLPQPA